MQQKKNNSLPTTGEIALIGVMTATLEVGKLTLSFLPNVEIVSLLIILYTLCFGKKTIYAIATFILLEGFLYGFGIWWISYLYVWPLLSFLAWRLKKYASSLTYALLSGAFGLFFGALCSLPTLLTMGWHTALGWWIAGIPYDIIHCAGNFLLCLILFHPLHLCLQRALL